MHWEVGMNYSRIALFKADFITCNHSSRHIVIMSRDMGIHNVGIVEVGYSVLFPSNVLVQVTGLCLCKCLP